MDQKTVNFDISKIPGHAGRKIGRAFATFLGWGVSETENEKIKKRAAKIREEERKTRKLSKLSNG